MKGLLFTDHCWDKPARSKIMLTQQESHLSQEDSEEDNQQSPVGTQLEEVVRAAQEV